MKNERPPNFSRLCYAAAHVIMRDEYRNVPHSVVSPGSPDEIGKSIDWEATMNFRKHLNTLGFGIAEAMDTAQRFSLGWENAKRLIQSCGQLDLSIGMIAGAGVDHLNEIHSAADLVKGVVHQAKIIQEAGGEVILLPIAWLPEHDADEQTYVDTYTALIDALDGPLYLHWLGEMFAANLAGYFPGDSFFRIMAHDPTKVRGAKLSLLDDQFECETRKRLEQDNQIVLTGDDFHFASLIHGEDPSAKKEIEIGKRKVPAGEFSHALLGIFDGIAAPASRALQALAAGDSETYNALMQPCEALGQCIFQQPTNLYKSGLAFLAWLNGHQENYMLLNHEELMRPAEYYEEVYRLAGDAEALTAPDLANERIQQWRADQP